MNPEKRLHVGSVQAGIEQLSQFSYHVRGNSGVTRLAFTEEEDEALEWAQEQLERFGYACRYDPFLNLHAYDPRREPKRIMLGTHVDTVINGGRYDGAAGLIAYLETLRILDKCKGSQLPVDLVVFRAEESTLFKVALLGSKVATGSYDLEETRNLHYPNAEELDDAIVKLLSRPDLDLHELSLYEVLRSCSESNLQEIHKDCWLFDYPQEEYLGYIEVHIEQGRVLESNRKDLGIVTSFRAPLREVYQLSGSFDHSGTTPMGFEYRRDALCGASDCILKVEEICNKTAQQGLDVVGTVGVLHVPHMGINKVPGKCSFTLDLRSNDATARNVVHQEIRNEISEICHKRRIELSIECTENSPPVFLNGRQSMRLQSILERAAQVLGYKTMRMPSGAGHDAMRMAQVGMPVCMIFIPCEQGVSHSPLERAKPEDILKSSHVLAHFLSKVNEPDQETMVWMQQ